METKPIESDSQETFSAQPKLPNFNLPRRSQNSLVPILPKTFIPMSQLIPIPESEALSKLTASATPIPEPSSISEAQTNVTETPMPKLSSIPEARKKLTSVLKKNLSLKKSYQNSEGNSRPGSLGNQSPIYHDSSSTDTAGSLSPNNQDHPNFQNNDELNSTPKGNFDILESYLSQEEEEYLDEDQKEELF